MSDREAIGFTTVWIEVLWPLLSIRLNSCLGCWKHARLQSQTLHPRENQMELYQSFIGIDIGKLTFVAGVHGDSNTREFDNTPEGIAEFIRAYQTLLPESLCIVEPTGGHEMGLLLTLCDDGFKVHRANARNVKHFIRSFGNKAKTDALDAKALAKYGHDRASELGLYVPPSKKSFELYELTQRRQDLKKHLVAEKNRLKAPTTNIVKRSIEFLIEALVKEITIITETINETISVEQSLQLKKEVLKAIPGIGDVTANDLLVLFPELGTLTRREAASLAGLAPRANDSGQVHWLSFYRLRQKLH